MFLHLCNLRCEYCFADGGTYNGAAENMSLDVALKAIDMIVSKARTGTISRWTFSAESHY